MNIETIRHSLSHILMHALVRLYGAVPGVGPAVENGFYHDFDCSYKITEKDLPKIEKEMRKIIKENLPVRKKIMPVNQAIKFLKKKGYKYTAELAEDLKKEKRAKISFYEQNDFINMCKGPHLKSTGEINPETFKLTKVSGAYWKGDEKNKMLQRIYGIAFHTKKELNEYLLKQVEAEKRDHRKLGKDLELFHIDDNVGKGLPLWMPKGAILRQILERFIEDEETKRGYLRTYTPVIGNVKLYKMSGHWDHYRDDMYPPMKIDEEEYVLRPMTCPHQFMIYKAKPRSYKELPLRYAELAEMYRKEKSGELTGLIRVMGFTLNDAHIICAPEQMEKEFMEVLDLIKYCLKSLGLEKEVWFRASLHDKQKTKYINNEKLWKTSEAILKRLLKKAGIKYEIGVGEATFYGPKADIQIKNIQGKEETIITIQIDLNSAERFDMSYIDKQGKKKRPVIIHRSAIGCIERTVAYLIEHYAGAFPVWLSPVQVQVAPISQNHKKYAGEIFEKLKKENIRAELKEENETISKKIREFETQKIPYLLVVGDKEIKNKIVSVRKRKKGDTGAMKLDKFIEKVKIEINNKK